MKILTIIMLLLLAPCYAESQWSTSTAAESTMYVTPGFAKGILSFEDGSSIVMGVSENSRYLQKLDSKGYKIWNMPVLVYNLPGIENTGNTLSMVSDGSGGVILWWGDTRGGEVSPDGFKYNNAITVQRINSEGNKQWGTDGKTVLPLAGGGKLALGVSDGAGGVVFCVDERDFLRPLGAKRTRTWLKRYNASGQLVWDRLLDTAYVDYILSASQPVLLGSRVMISTLKGLRFFHPLTGEEQSAAPFSPGWYYIMDGDTAMFRIAPLPTEYDTIGNWTYYAYSVTRFNQQWDSIWGHNVRFKYTSEEVAQPNVLRMNKENAASSTLVNTFLPDQAGGLFFPQTASQKPNSIQLRWINRNGVHFTDDEVTLPLTAFGVAFHGKGTYGVFDETTGMSQSIDTSGALQWQNGSTTISDPWNAYSLTGASDHHGGGIIVYWTVQGGIYAQHTGRTGKAGILTRVDQQSAVVRQYDLFQNYPNPFNPATKLSYRIPRSGVTRLTVYDLLGRKVATLVDAHQPPGEYAVDFNGSGLSSGLYLYRLTSGEFTAQRTMMLLK